VPEFPELFDPDDPRGRWNRHPAIAFLVGMETEKTPPAEEAIRQHVGSWVLEDIPELGTGRVIAGSFGRGWEAGVPVVEWIGITAAGGIVGGAAWHAFVALVQRLRKERATRSGNRSFNFVVSRGAAAAIAADDITRSFGDDGLLEIQAVEEPSGIAGGPVHEISYVDFEPWIVLARSSVRQMRYVVVVEPNGEVAGRIKSPLSDWELPSVGQEGFR
jgi:hypothetical protein